MVRSASGTVADTECFLRRDASGGATANSSGISPHISKSRRLMRTAQWCRVSQCDVPDVFSVNVHALDQFSRIVQEREKEGSCGILGYFYRILSGHISKPQLALFRFLIPSCTVPETGHIVCVFNKSYHKGKVLSIWRILRSRGRRGRPREPTNKRTTAIRPARPRIETLQRRHDWNQ